MIRVIAEPQYNILCEWCKYSGKIFKSHYNKSVHQHWTNFSHSYGLFVLGFVILRLWLWLLHYLCVHPSINYFWINFYFFSNLITVRFFKYCLIVSFKNCTTVFTIGDWYDHASSIHPNGSRRWPDSTASDKWDALQHTQYRLQPRVCYHGYIGIHTSIKTTSITT